MSKIDLRSRLFFSHLLVLMVGISSLVIISKVSSRPYFVQHLEQLEGSGFRLRYVRTYLVKGFETSWNRSTFWAAIVGTTAAGGLSYWVARRITKPLTLMEQITKEFAAGQLDQRLPISEIPELNQLGVSFNRMAAGLEGVEQRRRELIGDLTHELRTPLTIVRGYLEELAEGRIEPSPDIYVQLTKETKRLERLVNDLQELSQAEAGYLPIHVQPIQLYPILKSLVHKFADQLMEDGPVLQLECSPDLPAVLADVDRTEQVLVNLIGNAMRYTQTGFIKVRAWTEKGKLWIAVMDTGQGIPAEDLPHVFERFWRGDRSRSRHSGGSGVGLAISKRLVELQGGEIFAESQFGKGSTFRFCLPLA
uniref:histidine kinase n=2 Tax=Desertifilaceae TaxID=1969992 RepID=A0A1E5QEX7_9CYAN|nr:HAMP domain-containing sensor histidine kinase [Desertifilum tharense]OEJ73178.1 two-component sensor histidine kinase [Desertifilum tharense IPPAS B-1220]